MSTDDKGLRREQGRRLKRARQQLNLSTAAQAAAFLKVPYDTYAGHENGNRGIGRAAEDYANKLGVPEEWLLRGKNPPLWAQEDVPLTHEDRRGTAEHFLRPWRLYRELSEEDLADRMGIPAMLIDAWENDGYEITDKWLRRLAEVLDTTPGSILDVDPGAVGADLLDLWRETSRRQREVRARIEELRKIA